MRERRMVAVGGGGSVLGPWFVAECLLLLL